jgi:ribosomal protein S18 acetylase RimI-like enzyme
MIKMEFRDAREGDAEAIAEVLKASYNMASTEEAVQAFLTETKKEYHYIVAVDNGIIIGFTSWQIHGLPKHGLFELDRIAVLPTHRGSGVAKQLFDALVQAADRAYIARGFRARKLVIYTHASNERAQAFYEKMGLKREEAILRDHYYPGVDEVIYVKFFD